MTDQSQRRVIATRHGIGHAPDTVRGTVRRAPVRRGFAPARWMILRRVLPPAALAFSGLCGPADAMAGEWFPDRVLHEPYLASPRTIQMKLGHVFVQESDISGAGADRWDVRLGDRFGLYRSDGAWQLSGFAGFNGFFDVEESWDNIGWDGRYGITLAIEWTPGHVLKLESRHQSAHVGDELIERTGRGRLDYSRDELNAGYSATVLPATRLYVETGWGWGLSNEDFQDPWRIQSGVEYGVTGPVPGGQGAGSGPFVAVDLEAMEERDWEADVNVHAGWFFVKAGNLWKFGLEYRDGRVPLGEFSASEERYLGFAVSRFAR